MNRDLRDPNCILSNVRPTPWKDNGLTDDQKIAKITENFREIMETLGLDLSDDSLADSPRRVAKNPWWRLLELLLLGAATLWIGFGFEAYFGQRQQQGWAFYAAAACLFVTLGFPGFVWRYLRKHRED